MKNKSPVSALENPISKSAIIRLAKEAGSDFSVEELLKRTLNVEHPDVAFRSAWLLETIMTYYPEKFAPHAGSFLDVYTLQSNHSCQRHFTKIMMLCLKNTNLLLTTKDDLLDRIIETTFDWLSGDNPVAVKANCLDVLYLMNSRDSWIKEELGAQIEYLMRYGSASIQSRGKRLLRKMKLRSDMV